MKKVFYSIWVTSLISVCSFQGFSQTSEISFRIKNAGIWVDGKFEQHELTYEFDSTRYSEGKFTVNIPVESINTNVKARDRHLLKPKYFDVDNHPSITFKSTSISKRGNEYLLKGYLQIKEEIKTIEIPFRIDRNEAIHQMVGTLEIDRRAYGVGKNHLIMGNRVEISLSVNYQ